MRKNDVQLLGLNWHYGRYRQTKYYLSEINKNNQYEVNAILIRSQCNPVVFFSLLIEVKGFFFCLIQLFNKLET